MEGNTEAGFVFDLGVFNCSVSETNRHLESPGVKIYLGNDSGDYYTDQALWGELPDWDCQMGQAPSGAAVDRFGLPALMVGAALLAVVSMGMLLK